MPDEVNLKKPVVIDNGTGISKNGFAGEEDPSNFWPTVVGIWKYAHHPDDLEDSRYRKPEYYIGQEAVNLKKTLDLHYPIKDAVITDWDMMEKLWEYTFHRDLRVDPERQPLLVTVSSISPKEHREHIAQIMFEKFKVPALYIDTQAVLALYGTGRETGVVVELGERLTRIVPIHNGIPITDAIQHMNLGGQHITEYLLKLLDERGYSFLKNMAPEIIEKIKWDFCYIALRRRPSIPTDHDYAMEFPYILPSGDTVLVKHERFKAPEIIFNPSTIKLQSEPLHRLVFDAIESCDKDLQPELYTNIVLSGGSSDFHGLKERLHEEVSELVSDTIVLKIIAPPYRRHLAWTGGSIFASIKEFEKRWITRKQFEKEGLDVVS